MKLEKFTKHSVQELTKCGIYEISIINKQDTFYIGQASKTTGKRPSDKGFYTRWLTHIRELENNRHHNSYLQKIVNKYGIDKIRFKIIEVVDCDCSIDFFDNLETKYIQDYEKSFVVLNFSNEAKSFKGLKHTEEAKKKMSISRKGKKQHPNTYKAIMKANIGRVKSEEERKNISKALTGKKRTEKQKQKMSEVRLGISLKSSRKVIATNENTVLLFDNAVKAAKYFDISYSHCRSWCRENKSFNGYQLSYETPTNRTNNHSYKPIIGVIDNVIVYNFESIVAVEKELMLFRTSIYTHLTKNTKLRKYPNLKLYYKEEYEKNNL